MLIGIAGPTASGKSTVTKMLVAEYEAAYMRYSSVLSSIAIERGLDPKDKATLQDLYITLREERGEDWLAKEILNRAKASETENLVIEGNRRKVDLETLRKVAEDRQEKLVLIFIDASPDTRFSRYNQNPDAHGYNIVTRSEFDELEANPAEDEIDFFRQYAQTDGIYINTDNNNIEEVNELVRTKLNI